jgi:hypothetical protein
MLPARANGLGLADGTAATAGAASAVPSEATDDASVVEALALAGLMLGVLANGLLGLLMAR